MQLREQFYLVVRSSIKSKAEEMEFRTEEEALAEAIRILKRGDLVEFGREIVGVL